MFSTEHIVVLEWPARGYFDAVALSGTLPRERTLRVAAIERWLERKDPAHPVLGPRAPISRQAAGRVVEESVGPSEYRATVEATSSDPTAFLLRVTHHPGWRATIDDKPATILRVAPDFMALEVPPGYHKIRFTFHRPTWTWLLLIFSLSVLYGLSVLARQRARSDATDA